MNDNSLVPEKQLSSIFTTWFLNIENNLQARTTDKISYGVQSEGNQDFIDSTVTMASSIEHCALQCAKHNECQTFGYTSFNKFCYLSNYNLVPSNTPTKILDVIYKDSKWNKLEKINL